MSRTVSPSVSWIASTSSPAIVRRSASCGTSRSKATYSRNQRIGTSIGVGCWVLGVGCWVLGVRYWVFGPVPNTEDRTPNTDDLKLSQKPEIVLEQQAD